VLVLALDANRTTARDIKDLLGVVVHDMLEPGRILLLET
jgi:hypothetical protein